MAGIFLQRYCTLHNAIHSRQARVGPGVGVGVGVDLITPTPESEGGAFERPPMISAPGRRREKRKAAFESSRKIISKSFRSFFRSGQNWGLQGSKFQNFPKRFFDNKIFNFEDRAMNLIPSCLPR